MPANEALVAAFFSLNPHNTDSCFKELSASRFWDQINQWFKMDFSPRWTHLPNSKLDEYPK